MIRLVFVLLTLSLIAGCAALELSPEEKAIRERARAIIVVQAAPTLSELQQYQELGPVTCEGQITSYGDADETCRDDLKVQAARLGATTVVIEFRDAHKCSYGEERCLTVKGRAYRQRPAPVKN